ncbi:MAG: hypothetical protein JWM73_1513 [Solirubrobacterales bacterium]|nr:hypothetical protein [Solirubrobacterales bacterium]
MPRIFRTILAAFAVALALAPAAGAAGIVSRHLWATVNVCDTLKHPDTIGVRASMPGSPHPSEQMYMRFRVQYFRAADQLWHNITKGGDSGYLGVGPAKYKARQAGRLFVFAPPAGGSFQLRGKVYFQWRRKGKVVRSAAELTTAGHRSTAGSDPPGYSSDTCVVS